MCALEDASVFSRKKEEQGDSGCEFSPGLFGCLTCPLALCKYDLPINELNILRFGKDGCVLCGRLTRDRCGSCGRPFCGRHEINECAWVA